MPCKTVYRRSEQIHRKVGQGDGIISKMSFIDVANFLYPLNLSVEPDIRKSVKGKAGREERSRRIIYVNGAVGLEA